MPESGGVSFEYGRNSLTCVPVPSGSMFWTMKCLSPVAKPLPWVKSVAFACPLLLVVGIQGGLAGLPDTLHDSAHFQPMPPPGARPALRPEARTGRLQNGSAG